MQDLIGYDKIVEESMRGVVKDVLKKVEKSGMVGEHYFVISFLTGYKGIKIPTSLKEKFPEEMTIVLQHQVNYLSAKEDSLVVSLSFSGKFEELTVPYSSITSFADPSINFGLKFNNYDVFKQEDGKQDELSDNKVEEEKVNIDTSAKVVSLDAFRKNKDIEKDQ